MPTIIDQLILELDLDPKKFEAAQSRAAAAWLKTGDAAKAGGKDIEDSSKRSADAIDRVTKSALGLFGVLVGAHSLKDFVADTIRTDAALGRMSTNLGMSAKDFGAWQAAAERVGGSAEATAASLQNANNQMMGLRVNANSLPPELNRLFTESGAPRPSLTGTTQDFLLSVAAAAQAEAAKHGAQRAAYLLQQSGYDAGTANLMMSGGGTQANLNSMPVPNNQTIERMQKLQDRWANLQQTFSTWAANTFGDSEPGLGWIIGEFQQFGDLLNDFEAKNPGANLFAALTAGALASLFAISKLIGGIVALKGLLTGGAAVADAGEAAAGAAAAGGGGLLGLLAVAAGLGVDAWNNTIKPAGASEDALVHQMGLGVPTGSHVDYLRQVAKANGLDPVKFVRLAQGEGLNNGIGDDRSSFGDFMLHYGNVSSQYPAAGLGDDFTKQTGLDARDSSTWKQQADWVGKYIAAHGADRWSAARKLGIANSMHGASTWAPWANLSGRQPAAGNNISIGAIPITINGGADADRIAGEIKPALKRAGMAQLANYGPA